MEALEALALATIVGIVLLIGWKTCFGPEETLAFLLYDDAYYYFGVARNLAAGAGSTFDGINPTNGYHPLWCWILVPIFWLIPQGEPGLALRVAAATWFLFAAAAPLLVWKLLRPSLGAGAVLAAALFGMHPFIGNGLARPNGLETPIYAVAILTFLLAFERTLSRSDQLPGVGSFAKLGLLLGVVVLARLDAGFLAIAAAMMIASWIVPRFGYRAAFEANLGARRGRWAGGGTEPDLEHGRVRTSRPPSAVAWFHTMLS